jgi:hypothetical protein
MPCSETQINEIVQKGVYYYPASSHYVRPCTVTCDRCMRTNLEASIGYNNLDLCMICVNIVAKNIETSGEKHEEILMRMMSDRFFEDLRNKRNERKKLEGANESGKNNSDEFDSQNSDDSDSLDPVNSNNYRQRNISKMISNKFKPSTSKCIKRNSDKLTLMVSSKFDVND